MINSYLVFAAVVNSTFSLLKFDMIELLEGGDDVVVDHLALAGPSPPTWPGKAELMRIEPSVSTRFNADHTCTCTCTCRASSFFTVLLYTSSSFARHAVISRRSLDFAQSVGVKLLIDCRS